MIFYITFGNLIFFEKNQIFNENILFEHNLTKKHIPNYIVQYPLYLGIYIISQKKKHEG